MTQQARRRDPYPWTWEIAVGVVVAVGLLLTGAVHVGRAVANLTAGGGWSFPDRSVLFTSLPGVLRGDATAGLAGFGGPAASPTALWVWTGGTELLVFAVVVIAVKVGFDRWGPARMRGMATRAEAERMLGVSRLRSNRSLIRPDLYTTQERRPR